jgi:hypothetical protein
MPNYLYENIRKIPSNLTCGDLIDMRNYLNDMVNCCRNISVEQKQVIGGAIFANFERKILRAVNSYLGEIEARPDDIINNPETDKHLTDTIRNPWSTSPQIPTITHNVNEFGHTPKRNSVHKTRHILSPKAADEVRALRNISRKFNLFVKNTASPIRKPVNIHLTDDAAHKNKYMIDISFGVGGNDIFIKFYNFSYLSPNCFYRFHFNPVDKEINSRDFWTHYSRRVTKNIAKAIRTIDNNPNNWYYMEVKRGDLD